MVCAALHRRDVSASQRAAILAEFAEVLEHHERARERRLATDSREVRLDANSGGGRRRERLGGVPAFEGSAKARM